MGGVDQSFEISEHITLKRELAIIEHVVHIPSHIFITIMKS
jgi:hypothetical protein